MNHELKSFEFNKSSKLQLNKYYLYIPWQSDIYLTIFNFYSMLVYISEH